MDECRNCGKPIDRNALQCLHCGAMQTGPYVSSQAGGPATGPIHRRRTGAGGLIAVLLVGILVVAAAGLGSAFAASKHWLAGSAEPQPGAPVASAPAQPSPPPQTTTEAPTTDPNAPPTTETQAAADLNAEVMQDQPAAEQLIGSWVPQLSSKKLGLVANGITYDDVAIWQDFQTLKSQYSNVLLIWSGNYSTYTSNDFWVTIVDSPYPSGAAANGWCDSEGVDANDCYAKLLSHTAGPTGATVTR